MGSDDRLSEGDTLTERQHVKNAVKERRKCYRIKNS